MKTAAPSRQLSAWLDLASRTARDAGRHLRQAGPDPKVWQEIGKDVKLELDREAESLIRERLGVANPLPIIGEEQGGDASLVSRYEPYWVVDPLDGTHNYWRGVPLTCVSIGLMRGETPVLGAIYDFHRDELFSGIVADGLTLNGRPVRPNWAASIGDASLQTGFPVGRDFGDASLALFVRRIQAYRKIRAIGSAALALAWVACGRFDAYYEEGIRLWDVAAGLALVQAAGGMVRMSPSSGKQLAYDVWAVGKPEFIAEA